MYYSTVDILALLVLLIQNQDIFFKRDKAFKKPAWLAYRRFLFTVIFYFITDIFWGVLEELKLSVPLFIDTSLYFVSMALGVLAFTRYAVLYLDENDKFGKILTYFGRVFAAVVSILTVINIFVPVLFTVDDKCVYRALGARYAVLIVQIITLLLISGYAFYVIIKEKSPKSKRYRTLGLFGFIMAIFLIVQLWFPYLPLYAIAYMLGTCLLHSFVIGDEKDEYRQGMEKAKELADLRHSITSLLNNMPVMSYSKDVETGVYLACNQSFAQYANKPSPSEVAGLTDYEIFDKQTARHFVADDKKAIAMDKPYVLYEDVADAAGNPRHFQTTKFKFYDENDKLCLLGMSLDITEMVNVRKENAETRAAYNEVLNASAIYENIVSALSKDYFNLYYVNLDTDEYIEYGSKTHAGQRTIENRGNNFFRECQEDALKFVYKQDLAELRDALDRDNLLCEIIKNDIFTHYYRLMIDGIPTYVSLKATRIAGDNNHIIIGVTNVDVQMRDRLAAEQAKEERKAYARLNALNNNLIAMYIVDEESGQYTEFSSTSEYDELGIQKQGNNFFKDTYENSLKVIHPDDQKMYFSVLTKENILKSLELDGVFVLDYRILIGEKSVYVRLKVAKVEEDNEKLLIVGIENIDAQIRHEQEFAQSLSLANKMATRDALTGVKNKFAFEKAEEKLNEQIANDEKPEFAIVVCDINDLKEINDTQGHKSGDEYIKNASAAICETFDHSPVFRIGGDEFAIICQGQDYENIDKLIKEIHSINKKHKKDGAVQIACGMAKFDGEKNAEDVFERADARMYEYKLKMKQ